MSAPLQHFPQDSAALCNMLHAHVVAVCSKLVHQHQDLKDREDAIKPHPSRKSCR